MAEWKEVESTVTAKLVELEKMATTLKTQVDSGEQLIQRHKTEIGDARKEIQKTFDEFKGLVKDPEKFKNAVDKILTAVDNADVNKKKDDTQGRTKDKEGTSDQVREIKLTDELRAKADEVFKKLKPEERLAIKSDPEKKRKFLEAAVEATSKVPESLFDEEPQGSKSTDDNTFRKLFSLASKEANHVPGDRRGGANGFAGSEGTVQETSGERRLPGGRIPRPVASPK